MFVIYLVQSGSLLGALKPDFLLGGRGAGVVTFKAQRGVELTLCAGGRSGCVLRRATVEVSGLLFVLMKGWNPENSRKVIVKRKE
jgi:hypothetical protein